MLLSRAATIAAAATLFTLNAPPALAAAISGMGTWETTLQSRDFDNDGNADAWYDTSLDVTWLNQSFYSTVAFGRVEQVAASMAALTAGGFTDWRLPRVLPQAPDGCKDCLVTVSGTSEQVYSEAWLLWSRTLGNVTPQSFSFNLGPMGLALGPRLAGSTFIDGVDRVPGDGASGTYELNATANTVTGPVAVDVNTDWRGYGWAVRSGDVRTAASPIPEPETTAMLLAGLGLLAVMRRWPSRRR